MEYSITDFISSMNTAEFDSFRAGVFYYRIKSIRPPYDVYQFQIPIEDTGGATFNASQKSVSIMRWVRRSIENKTFIKI
jgi:hypothetical protein